MKFKVGDEVWIKGVVGKIRTDNNTYPIAVVTSEGCDVESFTQEGLLLKDAAKPSLFTVEEAKQMLGVLPTEEVRTPNVPTLKVIKTHPHDFKFAHKGDSGKDLIAYFGDATHVESSALYGKTDVIEPYIHNLVKSVEIQPNERALIPTGISMEIPEGYEIQVRPKSGRSFKTGLNVILGTIDSNYRGEIMVIVHNISEYPIHITEGTTIAQAVLCPVVANWEVEEVERLEDTNRGSGGFGSTDTHVHDFTTKFGVVECQECGDTI